MCCLTVFSTRLNGHGEPLHLSSTRCPSGRRRRRSGSRSGPAPTGASGWTPSTGAAAAGTSDRRSRRPCRCPGSPCCPGASSGRRRRSPAGTGCRRRRGRRTARPRSCSSRRSRSAVRRPPSGGWRRCRRRSRPASPSRHGRRRARARRSTSTASQPETLSIVSATTVSAPAPQAAPSAAPSRTCERVGARAAAQHVGAGAAVELRADRHGGGEHEHVVAAVAAHDDRGRPRGGARAPGHPGPATIAPAKVTFPPWVTLTTSLAAVALEGDHAAARGHGPGGGDAGRGEHEQHGEEGRLSTPSPSSCPRGTSA